MAKNVLRKNQQATCRSCFDGDWVQLYSTALACLPRLFVDLFYFCAGSWLETQGIMKLRAVLFCFGSPCCKPWKKLYLDTDLQTLIFSGSELIVVDVVLVC